MSMEKVDLPIVRGTVLLFYQMSRIPLNHANVPLFCTSTVECRTHNRESLGSNTPFPTVSKFRRFVLSMMPQSTQLAIDSGGNVSE